MNLIKKLLYFNLHKIYLGFAVVVEVVPVSRGHSPCLTHCPPGVRENPALQKHPLIHSRDLQFKFGSLAAQVAGQIGPQTMYSSLALHWGSEEGKLGSF